MKTSKLTGKKRIDNSGEKPGILIRGVATNSYQDWFYFKYRYINKNISNKLAENIPYAQKVLFVSFYDAYL